jgi:hypothetical protein
MEAKRELGNQPRRRTGLRRTIQQILKDCIDAGQYIHSPGDRATLQWLAREVGDALFSITREYPSTVIKAARAGLMEVTPPHVFFSYIHDSPEHVQMVAELADRLCADGVNALIDQYMSAPPTGWLHWVGEQLEVADFVLMICTRTYSENLSDNSTTETNKEERAIGDLVRRHLFDGRCNGPQ